MRDRIELRGLRVMAYCGVLPEEQQRRQPFELDVDVYCDLTAAGGSDDLADTVDYGALCDRLAELASQERFALMERFAAAAAEAVVEMPMVGGATVRVTKVRPPVATDLATAGVRVSRGDTPTARGR